MGVYTFTFPADFQPEFEKEYNVAGSEFDIQVQYLGVLAKQFAGAVACNMWAFRLIVKGNVIHEGPYYWGIDRRDLTAENVANHLASYWGHDKTIVDAQDLEGSPEYELDQIVQRCAEAMFRYYMQDEPFDYDIISKYMDEYGWEVMLMPNVLTAKKETPYGKKQSIFSFKQFPQQEGQYMTVYDLEHSVYTKL